MTRQTITNLLLIMLIVGLLSGCASLTSFKLGKGVKKEIKPENVPSMEDKELAKPQQNEEILALSEIEKLGSAAEMLETATHFRSEGQLTPAGYYLTRSLMILSLVDRESLNEQQLMHYKDLISDINNFYAEYVAEVDMLPEEVPPEAVMAGAEEYDIDTIAVDTVVVDSLGVAEKDLLVRPTVEFDSSEVGVVLDTIKKVEPIPLVRNKRVEGVIKYWQTKGRKPFSGYLSRAGRFIPMIKEILREQGLPEELVFLAMIESGFKTNAYSRSHASGIWQFIKSTGKIFGLYSDWWVDERRDPVKATHAAARYLKKLHLDFDDWYLALAAYNCGEGRVARHIRTFGTRDYWKLKRLPRETRSYVPLYISAAIIAQNPTEYGFSEIVYTDPVPVDSVIVTESVDLEQVAKLVGSSYETIKSLNPTILRWCTPPTVNKFKLYLPHGTAVQFEQKLAEIPPAKKHKWISYRVRSGESLSQIAAKHGTTMSSIRSLPQNKIRNIHKIKVGQKIWIPVPPDRYKQSSVEFTVPASTTPQRRKITHTVQKGENLTLVARKYGTSVTSLKKWNNLYHKRFLHPGDKLKIWTSHVGRDPEEIIHHTVLRGESLSGIAALYNSSIRSIAKLNGMKKPYTIHPDQELVIRGEASMKSSQHSVRRGENLTVIARRYGTTVSNLADLNNLRRPYKLKIGDVLRIEAATKSSDPDYHIVRRGESLWTIAKRYNMSTSGLARLNGIKKPYTIHKGDKLQVAGPKSSGSQFTAYRIQKGDTLWDISLKYDVSITELKRVNNIHRHRSIKPGQTIQIPVK